MLQPSEMWEPLKEGDTIAIISTGYALNQQNLEAIVSSVRKAMPMFNFSVPTDLLSEACQQNISGQTMPSNTPDMCASHVIRALIDPSVKAIWCLTGSEGSSGTVTALEEYQKNYEPLLKGKKPIIGLSDTTSLQIYLHQHELAVAIYGDLLTTLFVPSLKPKFKTAEQEIILTVNLLMGGKSLNQFIIDSSLKPLNDSAKATKALSGTVVGGCKELIDDSFGTPWQIKTLDTILFLEGLDQPWISQGGIHTLKRIREFFEIHGKPKALIIGQIESFKVKGEAKNAFFSSYQKQIEAFAKSLDIPVFQSDAFGHNLSKISVPIPMGSVGTISLNDEGYETFKFSTNLTTTPKLTHDKETKEEKRTTFSDTQYTTILDIDAFQLISRNRKR